AYASRATGAVHVYLRQAHQGIPVHDATAQAAYAPDGRVVAPHARLVAGLAERVNATVPSLTAQAAAEALVAHLVRTGREWYRPGVIADTPGEWDVPAGYLTPESERAALVYAVTEGGAVRLSWSVEASARDGRHHFAARVDAETGRVLALDDRVDRDTWGAPPATYVPDHAPLARQAPALVAARALPRAGSYNVFPCVSPSHCAQRLVHDPADPDASPLGWHLSGADP